ncbi:MAG: hypothetical protein H8D78_07125 [Chloroflexi bacterium]|nr:hypothetical protein [Chloroflexota bacterium]
MLEQVHQHIVSELQQSARTDTIFVVTAVVFNLVVLGINSAVAAAASGGRDVSADAILGVLIVMNLLINSIAVVALYLGRATRGKLLKGLLTMYGDKGVAQYYDESLLVNYGRRYMLFIGVILCLAVTSIVVPLVIRIL